MQNYKMYICTVVIVLFPKAFDLSSGALNLSHVCEGFTTYWETSLCGKFKINCISFCYLFKVLKFVG